jgi:hypothetical protein
MNYYATTMSQTFEREKNRQAAAITAGFAGGLLLLMFLWKWQIVTDIKALLPQGEFIEINLGVDDFGSGTDQPMTPGDPAPQQQIAYTPAAAEKSNDDNSKDIEEDEADKEPAKVYKPTVVKPEAKEINKENKVVKVTPKPAPPAPPQPKKGAQMTSTRGGNGSGGNGAETYQKGAGEGIAGGRGDQGVPGGSPTGTNYSGTPRNLGVRVVNMPSASFEDDFNESGIVALDITVNDNGKLTASSFQPRGSTLSNRAQIDIAKRRAAQLQYPKYEGGFTQTIKFEFKVKG